MDIEKYDVVVFLHSLFWIIHQGPLGLILLCIFFLWVRFPGEYLNFWVLPNIMWFLCHAVLCAGMFEEVSNFQKYFSWKLGRQDLLWFTMKPFFVVVLKDLFNILYITLFPDIWNIFRPLNLIFCNLNELFRVESHDYLLEPVSVKLTWNSLET